MKIIESANYKKRIRNIAFYIKKDNPSAAINFVKNLKKSINELKYMPKKTEKITLLR